MDARYGAIVLCGGASTRMGRDKAWLPWGPDATMLQHVVRILERVEPNLAIVIVAASGQLVPPLPRRVTLVHEPAEGCGPLGGLVEGLANLPAGVEWAFVCGSDAPLIRPEFVQGLIGFAANAVEAIVPVDDARLYPLAAAYSRRCLPGLRSALADDERSLQRALRRGRIAMQTIPVAELRDVDPQLDSLINCNTPEEYEQAVERARRMY
jgi:molybdopterin-guanine dinucleotide biosynthesis protein A